MKKYLLIILLCVLLPQIAFAGSQTYSTPGSFSFTVPSYGTLTVTVSGAGGGGSSGRIEGLGVTVGTKTCGYSQWARGCIFQAGAAGGYSAFNSGVVAYGGTGAPQGAEYFWSYAIPAVPGSSGSGTGGSVTTGGGASGGTGGQVSSCYLSGIPMCGASGGAGGRVVTTYSAGSLTPGSAIPVVVGGGGVGGVGYGPDGYGVYAPSGSAGSPGSVTITWTDATPTCSVTLAPSSITYGSSSTLTYSSTNATTLYINNIGYVSTSGGSTSVSPSSTTNYSCTAVGAGGTGEQDASLTVTPPSTVTSSITASSSAIYVGESTGIHATFSAGSGDTLTGDNIDSPVGTGLGASTNPDTDKWYTFTPSSAGTYTFYSRATTEYYTSWTTYDTVDVVVTAAPACTLSLTPSTVAQGNSSTLAYSSSNATTFSIDGIGSLTPNTSGSTSVSPSVSTTYTGSATAGGVTNTCTDTLTVSCTPAYSCSSQTIQYTNAACAVSDVTTCVSPAFCSTGSATCLYAPVEYVASGSLTGHLQAAPQIVTQGTATRLYWNLDNVESCTVTGTNGDSYSGASSPAGGRQTSAIEQQTIYTLSCAGSDGSSIEETQTVNILPVFNEQ